MARQQLEQDDAEREHIRAVIELCPRDLFRRHVERRAHYHSRVGASVRRDGVAVVSDRLNVFGEAEIQYLDVLVTRHQDVRRLQVAVHEPLVVGDRDRLRQRGREFDHPIGREPLRRNELIQGAPVNELHREEMNAVDLLCRIERGDVRVIECRSGPRLSVKPHHAVRIRGHVRRQNLERDLPAEPGVGGSIDFTHSARTKQCVDLVVTEMLSGGEAHVRASLQVNAETDQLGPTRTACVQRSILKITDGKLVNTGWTCVAGCEARNSQLADDSGVVADCSPELADERVARKAGQRCSKHAYKFRSAPTDVTALVQRGVGTRQGRNAQPATLADAGLSTANIAGRSVQQIQRPLLPCLLRQGPPTRPADINPWPVLLPRSGAGPAGSRAHAAN